jgi:hypothetical protein
MAKTQYEFKDDEIIVHRSSDVSTLLEINKMKRDCRPTGEFFEVAEFDGVIVEHYLNTHGVSFEEFMANPEHILRMARDPALAYFRTWNGKI